MLTKFLKTEQRRWLLGSAVFFAFGVLAKFPYGIMIVIPIGLLLALRNARRLTLAVDVALFTTAVLMPLLFYYLDLREWMDRYILFALRQQVTQLVFSFDVLWRIQLYLVGVPILLALFGLWIAWRQKNRAAWVLFGAVFIFPVYHLTYSNNINAQKHVVMGFIFAYPLIGLVFARLWRSPAQVVVPLLLAALFLFGRWQWSTQEYSWPDVRPATRFLLSNVQRGDRVMSEMAWSFVMYLYPAHQVERPNHVLWFSNFQSDTQNICDVRWIVLSTSHDEQSGNLTEQAIQKCGYASVYHDQFFDVYAAR